MKGTEFVQKVIKEVGFELMGTTKPGFAGVPIYNETLVLDPNGEILRKATEEDIRKWNEAWNRLAAEAYKASQQK